MRDDDRLDEVERRLNSALRPGDEAVARVITGALHAHSQPSRRRIAPIAASILAAALAAFILWRNSTPAPPAMLISGTGSVLVITTDDGRRWVLHGQRDTAVRGQYVIAFPQ